MHPGLLTVWTLYQQIQECSRNNETAGFQSTSTHAVDANLNGAWSILGAFQVPGFPCPLPPPPPAPLHFTLISGYLRLLCHVFDTLLHLFLAEIAVLARHPSEGGDKDGDGDACGSSRIVVGVDTTEHAHRFLKTLPSEARSSGNYTTNDRTRTGHTDHYALYTTYHQKHSSDNKLILMWIKTI